MFISLLLVRAGPVGERLRAPPLAAAFLSAHAADGRPDSFKGAMLLLCADTQPPAVGDVKRSSQAVPSERKTARE